MDALMSWLMLVIAWILLTSTRSVCCDANDAWGSYVKGRVRYAQISEASASNNHRSPLTAHRSPLTAHRSPLTARTAHRKK
eukprot:7090419-Pyramimonas_sp.AAC.3